MEYVESGMEKSVPVLLYSVVKSAIEWYTVNTAGSDLTAYFYTGVVLCQNVFIQLMIIINCRIL